jgi:excisionase family DNA binding protein
MSELTVKEYAAVERVTERTVRNWISKGAVVARRTPGGHVRIRVECGVAFIGMKKAETSGNSSA